MMLHLRATVLPDLVAFDRDPRESLEVLATPSMIVLDGRVIERKLADV